MEESLLSDKDITIDELIDIASNPGTKADKTVITDTHHLEIRKFIRARDIKSADNPIHARMIYDYYFEWSEAPMPYKRFVKYMTLYFTKVRSSQNMILKVSPESFGLPDWYSVYRDERFLSKKQLKKSRFIGVYPIAGYFIARFKTEENTHYLGRFKTEKEAAISYDKYAYLHFGLTTKLNFPENKDVYEKEITQEAIATKK